MATVMLWKPLTMHYFTASGKILISINFSDLWHILKMAKSVARCLRGSVGIQWEGQRNMKEDGKVQTSEFVLPMKHSRNRDA